MVEERSLVCNKRGEKPFFCDQLQYKKSPRNKEVLNNRVNLVDIGNRALSDGWVKPTTEISNIALSSM